MASRYAEVYARWQADPEAFWEEAARAVEWMAPPARIFHADAGVHGRWFPDATLNACFNLLDRHVRDGRGQQVAIIHDSPLQGFSKCLTYAEVLHEVETLAAVFVAHGVTKGDRVLLYMPMVPEALIGMYACARIGAIHSVVFGGFAAKELATRIDDAAPKMVLAASCGLEPNRVIAYKPLLDAAIALATHKPDAVLVLQRLQLEASLVEGRDLDWAHEVAAAKREGRVAGCVEMQATDPLYILYTSGTTGVPKGVVRDTGGYLVALAWSMRGLYDIAPGEVFWTASDVGWVVGHSYIVYAPLLIGATTLVYEGKPIGTPDAGAFWRVCAEHKVVSLFTAPTALRAIKKDDPGGVHFEKHNTSPLRALFLAGERADANTVDWARDTYGLPIIDHWWQTETGWAIAGNPVGLGMLPIKPGSPTVPMPGFALEALDDAGNPVPPGTMGSLVIKLPMPPGCLPTLWKNDARMRDSYLTAFPGSYNTSDSGAIDADGYVFILGRTDDIINCAGHRLSTGGMEEVLAGHPDVAECAVIGMKDAIKGEAPCGFLVLKAGVMRDHGAIEAEAVSMIRDAIGPVASFKLAIAVDRLPKTRSGKILRGTMKKIADHDAYAMPATIEDPATLDTIAAALRGRGL
ncbi:AMP-binding protein [Beijerinckia sp. L45]|uniref:AMP-binding protein n=1 Tax=Beijerinckia sp. L45 TaxID=1641855 RepID=UPI00131EA7C0|nr:AMP-binding protein [Beijerinckia sp. L45]